jgi:TrpR-related protein YerC/YecD
MSAPELRFARTGALFRAVGSDPPASGIGGLTLRSERLKRYSMLKRWNERLMVKDRKSIRPTRDSAALTRDLCAALLTPANVDEMSRFLADLCTPSEISALAERWHVARLLDETDLSYREIHDATGVSTTTIVRVGRFLRQEPHRGYRSAIDKMRVAHAG